MIPEAKYESTLADNDCISEGYHRTEPLVVMRGLKIITGVPQAPFPNMASRETIEGGGKGWHKWSLAQVTESRSHKSCSIYGFILYTFSPGVCLFLRCIACYTQSFYPCAMVEANTECQLIACRKVSISYHALHT